MKKIKWGIISTGKIAHSFAQDFKYVESGELVAVASRGLDKAQEFASQYNIPTAYGSYEELFSDPAIDAVYIATPHNFHLENSKSALTAGKAVLCEKPFTINTEEGEELIAFAQAKDVYLMEAMWSYFLPAIKKAQEWVKQGRIGELVQVKADFGYPVPFDPKGRMFNPDLAGGSLLDMGIYPIAMAWLFFQKDPKEVKVVSTQAPTGVDYEVSVLMDYGKEVANLASSFRSKLFNHLFIIGTEGYIQVPDFWKAKDAYLYKVEERVDHFHDDRESLGLNFEIASVNQDLLAGRKESQIMPHATSLKFQNHMDWIRSSIQ